MFRYIFLFLIPIAIQCQDVFNSSSLQLNVTVISPYRRAFTLLRSDIVNKLMNINLTSVNHSFSNLADEFHCTVQSIQSNLQQAAQANQMLIDQVDIHVNQLLESISRLKNETEEIVILIKELNKTIEGAQENIRDPDKILDAMTAHYFHSNSFRHRKSSYDQDRLSFGSFEQRPFLDSLSRSTSQRDIFYKIMDNTVKYWVNHRQLLQDKMAKYNESQYKLMNNSQQLTELNTTLEREQNISVVAETLNKHFQLITNRLKTISNPSKRFIDVLMHMLDYKTIVKPLNSINEKLFDENLIESNDFKLSEQVMKSIRHKVLLLTTKVPQLRSRRKYFQQPCIFK